MSDFGVRVDLTEAQRLTEDPRLEPATMALAQSFNGYPWEKRTESDRARWRTDVKRALAAADVADPARAALARIAEMRDDLRRDAGAAAGRGATRGEVSALNACADALDSVLSRLPQPLTSQASMLGQGVKVLTSGVCDTCRETVEPGEERNCPWPDNECPNLGVHE